VKDSVKRADDLSQGMDGPANVKSSRAFRHQLSSSRRFFELLAKTSNHDCNFTVVSGKSSVGGEMRLIICKSFDTDPSRHYNQLRATVFCFRC
jgi:hypothetical protein